MSIDAIFENGVFRPTVRVHLPQSAKVRLHVEAIPEPPKTEHRREIYELLSESCDTGDPYLAARHDEHQP